MPSGLQKYGIQSSIPFKFYITTYNPNIRSDADQILKIIGAYTGKKDSDKLEFMVKLLINFNIGWKTAKMTSISRKPGYYSKIIKRNRFKSESYEISKNIIDKLVANKYIDLDLGFHNLNDGSGQLSKMKPLGKLDPYYQKINIYDLKKEKRNENIILRDDDKVHRDYIDTPQITGWRNDIIAYNTFLQKNVISLKGLSVQEIQEHSDYFEINYLLDNYDISNLTKNQYSNIILGYPDMYRIFNKDFKNGGRFYGGIETMPSELRKYIHINGNPTIELDYSSVQIRMLYHMEKINYTKNAYEALCGGDPMLYKIYKLVALVDLNSIGERQTLQALRKKLINKDILPSSDTTNIKLKPMINNWQNIHKRIEKYFRTGIGGTLQFYESEIANGILKYFREKNILVLSVHDSFLIEEKYKDELRKAMRRIYHNQFKFYPQIK